MNAPVAVVGPGAIGLFLAHRLSRAGLKVVLVGKDERWRRGAARGLKLETRTPSGAARMARVRAARLETRPRGPACAAVFVCVKAGSVPAALRAAKPLAGPETAVVSLQNGLGHRGALRAAFGPRRSVVGVTFASCERVGPFQVRHHGGDRFALAEGPENAAAATLAARLLARAGLKVDLVRDEDALLWTKAAFNAATNPVGALTGRSNGDLVRVPALRDLVMRAAREAAAVAKADGRRTVYPSLERALERGLAAAPTQSNSMLQDLRAGRRTEVDAIVGPFLQAARRRRRPAPLLGALHALIKRVEREAAR